MMVFDDNTSPTTTMTTFTSSSITSKMTRRISDTDDGIDGGISKSLLLPTSASTSSLPSLSDCESGPSMLRSSSSSDARTSSARSRSISSDKNSNDISNAIFDTSSSKTTIISTNASHPQDQQQTHSSNSNTHSIISNSLKTRIIQELMDTKNKLNETKNELKNANEALLLLSTSSHHNSNSINKYSLKKELSLIHI